MNNRRQSSDPDGRGRRIATVSMVGAVYAALLAVYGGWVLEPGIGQPLAAFVLEFAAVMLYALLNLVLISRGDSRRHEIAFTLTALAVVATIVFPPLETWPAKLPLVVWAVIRSLVFFANPAPIIHLVSLIGRRRLSYGRMWLVTIHWVGLVGLALALVPAWLQIAEGAEPAVPLRTINHLLYLYTGILSLTLLVRTARHGETLEARRQAGAVVAGLLPWTALQLVGFAPEIRDSAPLLVVEGAVLLLIPVSLFVAVAGFRLFGVTLPVRKSLIYALTLSVPLVALVLIWLGAGAAIAGAVLLRPTVANVAVLLALLLFMLRPVAARLVRRMDRIFFPEKVALRKLTRTLIPDLAQHETLGGVADELVDRLVRELGLRGAGLLLVAPEQVSMRPVAQTAGCRLETLPLASLPEPRDPHTQRSVPLREMLPSTATELGERALLVPVRLGGRLVGAIAVGEPLAGAGFDRWDIEHLELLAQQASAVLEHARVSELARIDPLTRLPRRAVFEQQLESELLRSRRSGSPLTIAVLDVDDFKRVNDEHGHLVGDRVLESVADALRQAARATDLVARWGGEEFALLMPDTGAEGAARALDKLLEAVRSLRVDSDPEPLAVTASIGATVRASGDDAATIVARADEAMYDAKRAGKDRLVLRAAPPPASSDSPRT